MKMLYVANIRFPTEKAHGLQIASMCKVFAKKGIDLCLLVPKRHNHIETEPFEYYGLENTFTLKMLFAIDLLPYRFIPEIFSFWVRLLTFLFSSTVYCWRNSWDVLYTRSIFLAYVFSVFFRNKVVVFENHEPHKKVFVYKHMLRRIKKKIIVPPALEDEYCKMEIDPHTYVVAPNGVDINKISKEKKEISIWNNHFGIPKEDHVALYIGHFYKWKGAHTFVDSAEYLPGNVHAVLVGGTPHDFESMKSYVQEKNLENVHLHPFVPHDAVVPFLVSADLLVLPNSKKEQRSAQYTTPLKLFEYMASGVPIVASDLPSFSSFLINSTNAVLCAPDDSYALAKSILGVLSMEDRGERLVRAAHQNVQQYSWEKRAEQILSFIAD